MQRRHFIIFDVLPFVGTLLALVLLLYRPIGAAELGLFVGFWLVTGLGLTVGYHRLFTHRAFATSTAMSAILVVMGSMAGRGPMLSWAAMHRRHHESPITTAICIRRGCTATARSAACAASCTRI
jgi:stearoyl-CoA desaturase (delta-9 desaturase)